MSDPAKTAVIYYSSTGTVHELAQSVVSGAEVAGAEVRLLKVAELAPEAAVSSNPAWAAHAAATQDVPVAAQEDVLWADAVIFGSPTVNDEIHARTSPTCRRPFARCGHETQ
jgi:NAD(P)H dehydrogenase (quinone)